MAFCYLGYKRERLLHNKVHYHRWGKRVIHSGADNLQVFLNDGGDLRRELPDELAVKEQPVDVVRLGVLPESGTEVLRGQVSTIDGWVLAKVSGNIGSVVVEQDEVRSCSRERIRC